ncbi:MAG: TerB family tellurite resistance protein [Flavobacteriales bacterium]|nr:TerB family tellurite resistance protein [Flavobacteriales bacterium]
MAKFVKFIGGGLGWAMGGPIGAMFGYFMGSMIDNAISGKDETDTERPYGTRSRARTTPGDFAASLLVLSAAVMKADGKVLKSELTFVKDFFTRQFGADTTTEQMLLLKEILKQDIPLQDVCLQIKANMDYAARTQLMHYLFGIAQADGSIDNSEIDIIVTISNYMGISRLDFESIKAMFVKSVDRDYKVLELDPECTDLDVKRAYRKMATKFHPDKVSHLGEEHQKAAKEKFQKISESYENIKKKRGIR